MVKGKTRTGFAYSYDEKVTQSMRFLDAFVATQSSDSLESMKGLHDMVDLLLGKKKEALYKHLEKLNGTAGISECELELTDMINKLGAEGKN